MVVENHSIGIQESVQNSQTTSNNFFEGVLLTIFRFAPKEIFVVSRTASMNCFERCTHDYFQNIHLGKGLE